MASSSSQPSGYPAASSSSRPARETPAGNAANEDRGHWRKRWFGKMSDWGDEFEKRHFGGDFVGTLKGAPEKTFERMSDWGDDFERRHFDGDFLGSVAAIPDKVAESMEVLDDVATSLVEANIAAGASMIVGPECFVFDPNADPVHGGSSSSSTAPAPSPVSPVLEQRAEPNWETTPVTKTSRPAALASAADFWRKVSGAAVPAAASTFGDGDRVCSASTRSRGSLPSANTGDVDGGGGLWAESQRLQADLAAERDRRKGRGTALEALDKASRDLRSDVACARREVGDAEAALKEDAEQRGRLISALKQLEREHFALEGRKARLEVDVRRLHAIKAKEDAAIARAHRECEEEGPRAWALPGPVTDALKAAKVELAQVLGEEDQARLELRRECTRMHSELEAIENENVALRKGLEKGTDKSFKASVQRLLAVARGRQEALRRQ
eukprot:TRINITY_DN76391_c0_g1_i1.p1 TRINITY_DN76391_c0_g1~~TRINITY_DN76391_c0_g1_i1.p1  ORF type:complete len:453 (-),score=97.36 TRINITY_DN76391_c0_g1_i1:5-1330(-)